MTKPVLLTVDDDAEVLRAIERDLRRKYAAEYRVLRPDSGAAALEIVRELKLRNNPLALFLVDQRMPGLSGVEFLAQAALNASGCWLSGKSRVTNFTLAPNSFTKRSSDGCIAAQLGH